MVDLTKYNQEISEFLESSISRFQVEHGTPSSIGVYCCPWSGWITTNYNLENRIEITGLNCPDFEFVEFDILELPQWEVEYESEEPKFKVDDDIIIHNHDLGDENFNQIIFKYLEPIITGLKHKSNSELLLQMLDSEIIALI